MFALQGGVSLRLGSVLDREFTHIGTELIPGAALAVDLLRELFQQRLAMKRYLRTGDERFKAARKIAALSPSASWISLNLAPRAAAYATNFFDSVRTRRDCV